MRLQDKVLVGHKLMKGVVRCAVRDGEPQATVDQREQERLNRRNLECLSDWSWWDEVPRLRLQLFQTVTRQG